MENPTIATPRPVDVLRLHRDDGTGRRRVKIDEVTRAAVAVENRVVVGLGPGIFEVRDRERRSFGDDVFRGGAAPDADRGHTRSTDGIAEVPTVGRGSTRIDARRPSHACRAPASHRSTGPRRAPGAGHRGAHRAARILSHASGSTVARRAADRAATPRAAGRTISRIAGTRACPNDGNRRREKPTQCATMRKKARHENNTLIATMPRRQSGALRRADPGHVPARELHSLCTYSEWRFLSAA